MKKILILSSAKSSENRQKLVAFVDQVNASLGEEALVETRHYSQILMSIEPGEMRVSETVDGRYLKDYDLVYFKSYYRHSEFAVAIAEYLEKNRTKFICSELKSYISFSKLSQYAKLSVHDLPIPKTYYVDSSVLATQWQELARQLGPEFICKAIDAKGGAANYVVATEIQLHQILKSHPKEEFVCQEFIPNQSDIRLLVINFEVKLAIRRARISNDTHLNNTSQGAEASLVNLNEIPAYIKEIAVKAARLFDREIAGVDIIENSATGEAFILEVNASPQVSSGAFPEAKISVYNQLLKGYLS